MKENKNSAQNDSVLHTGEENNETEFTKALSSARPSDLSKRNEVTRKTLIRTALGGAIRYTAMLLCFLVFLGAAGYVASYALQYAEKQQLSDYFSKIKSGEITLDVIPTMEKSLEDEATPELGQSMSIIDIGDVTSGEKKEYNEYFESTRAQFVGLQRSYPDIYGWIDVPGTGVNYIIMQGKDNETYLYAELDGTYTRYGSIFADYRCSRNALSNRNLIIYGHNMNTANIMFAPLLDFAINEKAFQNQVINIVTAKGMYTYELFSVYDTSAKYNYIQTYFTSDDEFLEFCERCKKKSIFKKDVTFDKDSKILTLSTCTVRGDGMRWAFHAKLIGVYEV